MITHTPPLAGYLLIKTLVARQLPTIANADHFISMQLHIIHAFQYSMASGFV